jgi:FkbM family methyltransferase
MEKHDYPNGSEVSFAHSGDYGDTIYSLAMVAATPGQHDFTLMPTPGRTTDLMSWEHAAFLAPLIEAQPYIRRVLWSPKAVECSLDGWRDHLSYARNTIHAHGCTKGYPNLTALIEEPWLTVTPKTRARVIFVRTTRTRGDATFWKRAWELWHHEAIFLGLPFEHESFVAEIGPVPHVPIRNFLEAAQIIAGAEIVICNQTSLHAIAVGLGKAIVREAPEAEYLDNCCFLRQNELSIYQGETLTKEVVEALVKKSTKTAFQRQAVPQGWDAPCWIGNHRWHRYNFRDLLTNDTYGFRGPRFASFTKAAFGDVDPKHVVDVGGFIGLASWAMRQLWPAASFTIYEPNKDCQQLLWLNNPQARIMPAAIHSTDSWLSYSNQDDPGCNHCGASGPRLIPAVKLPNDVAIDVLKLDCEGGEWEILPHLAELRQLPRLIFGEYHGEHGPAKLTKYLAANYRLDIQEGSSCIGLFWAVLK